MECLIKANATPALYFVNIPENIFTFDTKMFPGECFTKPLSQYEDLYQNFYFSPLQVDVLTTCDLPVFSVSMHHDHIKVAFYCIPEGFCFLSFISLVHLY